MFAMSEKKFDSFSKMLKIELLYDPETPFLGIIPKRNKTISSHKNLYIHFIPALLMIR